MLAATALASSASSAPARPETWSVSVASLREVTIGVHRVADAAVADAMRQAVDGTEDEKVSAEEYSVFVSGLDYAVLTPDLTASAAYAYLWEAENESGSPPFSFAGRSNVTALVLLLAPSIRIDCRLDEVGGKIERVASSFVNLSGPLGRNSSIDERVDLTIAWPTSNGSRAEHRLEIAPPNDTGLAISFAGSYQILAFEFVANASVDGARAILTGVSGAQPVAVTFGVRVASTAALALVAVAVIAAAAAAVLATAWSTRRHAIADKPLPVVPKYK